mgnify:CR=1 FL=1
MNVRKPVDYGTMYRELTTIPAQNLPQMIEIYAIGKVISQRPEKGAAVAAAEFLQANFPDRTGFSPRNVRRMHDFYKVYENEQTLLRLAMKIGWTLNVVIMESELTRDARKWYLEQAQAQQWSKKELLEILSSGYEPGTEANKGSSSLRFSESCDIIDAKISFRTQRPNNTRWRWAKPRGWSDLPLTKIYRRVCWFMWSIWRAHPAEIRHCPNLENTLGSVPHCWRSGFSFPSITATAVQFI